MKLLLGLFKLLNFGLAAATLLAYLAPYVNPRDFWPLIFFGLAYPAFLIGNMLFIVFWFFIKKRMIWISSIVLLIGFQHVQKILGFNFQKKETSKSIKVLSFNTGGFYQFREDKYADTKDINDFYSFLKKEQFDIGSFQEFSTYTARKFRDKKSPYFKNIGNSKKALLIGSNLKMGNRGKIDFNNIPTNGITWADVTWQEKTIRVYSLHLMSNKISNLTNKFNFRSDFFSEKGVQYLKDVMPRYKNAAITRVKMVEKLKKNLEQCPYPVIICGDLNEPPVSYIYREISEGLKDSFIEKGFGWGKTYNGKIPGLRLDYIFVSPEIEVVDFKIIKNDFSDHFPVICNLKLNEG